MPDVENDLHQQPVPSAESEHKEEDEKDANHLAIGFAIFIPLGIALGLTVFDNVGIGVAVGLGMGSIYSILAGR